MGGVGRGRGRGRGQHQVPHKFQENGVLGTGRGRGRGRLLLPSTGDFANGSVAGGMEGLLCGPRDENFAVLNIPQFQLSGCNVPYRHIYSTTDGTAAAYSQESDDEFFQWTGQGGWIMGKGNDLVVTDLAKYCVTLINRPDYKTYGIKRLPNPEMKPKSKTEALCHVIRCSSPSDFHVIFHENHSWFELDSYDSKWTHFFRKRVESIMRSRVEKKPPQEIEKEISENYCFRAPYEVYCGVLRILTEFVKQLSMPENGKEQSIVASKIYCTGDLVVVTKPEKGEKAAAYRAVVIEPAKVIVDSESEPVEGCYMVYLLDTGEKRVVTKTALLPLPRPFICFKPLAVRCSLSRVAPTCGSEWSASTVAKIRDIFSSNRGDFFAKLFPMKSQESSTELESSSTLRLLNKIAHSTRFQVDLIDVKRSENVANLLTIQELASMNSFDSSSFNEDSEEEGSMTLSELTDSFDEMKMALMANGDLLNE